MRRGAGFLHGWVDENWALSSHRFWSGSIGRYFVHSAEATAAPHMLCSPMGTASSLSRGRILKGSAPNPSHLLCARHHRMAGPTLENGRAGRRGFLHGWLDENWALCSHRFWSGSIGRYFVHSAEATAAPTHALLTHGDCIIFIEGPKFERLRPQPIAPALRSAPQNGGPNTRKWTSWTAGVPARVARRELGPLLPSVLVRERPIVTSYTPLWNRLSGHRDSLVSSSCIIKPTHGEPTPRSVLVDQELIDGLLS